MANLITYGKLYLGSTEVDKMYLGDTCVYDKNNYNYTVDYSTKYLTFDILTNGYIGWCVKGSGNAYVDGYQTIQYSKNGGTWTTLNPSSDSYLPGDNVAVIQVSAGDKVRFKHYTGVTHYGCEYTGGGGYSWDTYQHSYHSFGASFGSGSLLNLTGATFNVSGNIMSLLYDDFASQTSFPSWSTANFTSNSTHLMGLFQGCTGLISAENLVLPATTVSRGCYADMFYGCTNMTKTPKELPGDINYYSYDYMFNGCTSLTQSPVIRATALTYGSGFTPSTSIHYSDNYYGGCRMMFQGCSSLNNITCLTTTYDYDTFSGWVNNVSSSGTFYKNSSMAETGTTTSSWTGRGVSKIPTNWTVVDYTE